MGIILSGGRIVTAVDCYQADVRIEGETIVAIGADIRQSGDTLVQAEGRLLFPGGIDPHTHFDLSVGVTTTADDFASGTKAAILGGTTTIIDFATQNKGETLQQALAVWHGKAAGNSFTDYGFHMAITDWNTNTAREMESMVQDAGISSFKLYMAYKNTLQVDDGCLLQALCRSKEVGALIAVHCENGDVIAMLVAEARAKGQTTPCYHPLTRPSAVEREAVSRVALLAEMAQAPLYIVHLSSGEGLEAAQFARSRGVELYAETCPQYLLLDESVYNTADFSGAKYVISPPLRSRDDQGALWRGLKTGAIGTVATDHCSFNFKGQKELGAQDFSKIPNGMPGVENRLELLYTYGVLKNKISLNQFVALTSTNAAKTFGLFPKKGSIAVGSDADIVIWNPELTSRITAEAQAQNVDYTPYEGFARVGKAEQVFLRGQQIVTNGRITDKIPRGNYLFRQPFLSERSV